MSPLRALVAGAVPVGIALAALLNATTVATLVDATLTSGMLVPAVHAASARATGPKTTTASADVILARNPFDHVAGSLRPRTTERDGRSGLARDPATAPPCDGVRTLVIVGHENQEVAFAALEVEGQRVLRRRGGAVGLARVAYVGRDRVWLERDQGLCQARLFDAKAPADVRRDNVGAPAPRRMQSALEIAIGKQIVKTGPSEYAIDRSAVERILEAQHELMKQRIIPEKEGNRVVGVRVLGIKPGSVLAMLGIEDGDRLETLNGYEVSDPEKMLEAYARLRGGADKLQIRLTRRGKPQNLDYVIR